MVGYSALLERPEIRDLMALLHGLGSLFQQFYNLADTIIVGRFVGVEALAAGILLCLNNRLLQYLYSSKSLCSFGPM